MRLFIFTMTIMMCLPAMARDYTSMLEDSAMLSRAQWIKDQTSEPKKRLTRGNRLYKRSTDGTPQMITNLNHVMVGIEGVAPYEFLDNSCAFIRGSEGQTFSLDDVRTYFSSGNFCNAKSVDSLGANCQGYVDYLLNQDEDRVQAVAAQVTNIGCMGIYSGMAGVDHEGERDRLVHQFLGNFNRAKPPKETGSRILRNPFRTN